MDTSRFSRTVVAWCPDWPVIAASTEAGISPSQPAAVFIGHRVFTCSAVARAQGVRRGMRQREAQAHCPDLVLLKNDEGRDARLFEHVATAIEDLIVGIEIIRPGLVAAPIGKATRYFGHELSLMELLVDHVSNVTEAECQVGVADTVFTATLAARQGKVVTRGESPGFLAPWPIGALNQPGSDRDELVEVLQRLGITTLGAFAALPEKDVAARFGQLGSTAHRLASGQRERPLASRKTPVELSVSEVFDPALDRLDAAAFIAKTMAFRLHADLVAQELSCTRLGITAITETGEERSRTWIAGSLTMEQIADRVRWQCEGWLTASDKPTSGIAKLTLEPHETISHTSQQIEIWQENTDLNGDKAHRALAHVQGILGVDQVFTAILNGGHQPYEQVHLVEWGTPSPKLSPAAPWPGRIPAPSPASVFTPPLPAQILNRQGQQIGLTDRHQLTAPPDQVTINAKWTYSVVSWAGPWLVGPQWWSPLGKPARIRLQACMRADPTKEATITVLLVGETGDSPHWTVEGLYD